MPNFSISLNRKIYYLDENMGGYETVLLLHGLGANSASWQLQIPALVFAGFRVVVPDAPGFGLSDPPDGKVSIKAMAADFASLLKSLGVASAHVVGISMGGTHAQQMAIDFPELIKSLVLVNTFATLRPKKRSMWFYYGMRLFLLNFVGMEKQAQFVSARIFPSPEMETARLELQKQILMSNPQVYRKMMTSFVRFNTIQYLSKLKSRTLIITAQNDNTVMPENQKILVDLIPGAKQIFIPDAGHAVIIDKPEKFNQVLLDFLQSR